MKKLLIYSLVIFIGLGIVYDITRSEINNLLNGEIAVEETSNAENSSVSETVSNSERFQQKEEVSVWTETPKVEQVTPDQPMLVKPHINKLRFPVTNTDEASVISFYGDPRAGGKRSHQGIDIEAPRGTPVVAVVEGTITSVGEKGNAGKFVWLTVKSTKTKYFYAHLDEQWVEEGARVKVGEALGTVGNTGNARHTLPHLHFEIRKDRTPIDPLPLLKKSTQP
jgi:murein DD-endopeptidase MepM/ murein hydrolase activator NlpD